MWHMTWLMRLVARVLRPVDARTEAKPCPQARIRERFFLFLSLRIGAEEGIQNMTPWTEYVTDHSVSLVFDYLLSFIPPTRPVDIWLTLLALLFVGQLELKENWYTYVVEWQRSLLKLDLWPINVNGENRKFCNNVRSNKFRDLCRESGLLITWDQTPSGSLTLARKFRVRIFDNVPFVYLKSTWIERTRNLEERNIPLPSYTVTSAVNLNNDKSEWPGFLSQPASFAKRSVIALSSRNAN